MHIIVTGFASYPLPLHLLRHAILQLSIGILVPLDLGHLLDPIQHVLWLQLWFSIT